jgi:hypothetical protein
MAPRQTTTHHSTVFRGGDYDDKRRRKSEKYIFLHGSLFDVFHYNNGHAKIFEKYFGRFFPFEEFLLQY